MNKTISAAKAFVKKFPTLSHYYRVFRDGRRSKRPLVPGPFGFSFIGNTDMERGVFEPEETKLIRSLLEGVDTFINVGANIGYYCCHALMANKRVIAVEPMGGNLFHLYRNVIENNWAERIQILPIALADSPKLITIYGGGTGASLLKGWAGVPSSYKTTVPCSTLDFITANLGDLERILIVMDVEGAENMVLSGAADTLSRFKNITWLVEICIDEHQPDGHKINPRLLETFNFFWQNGYASSMVGSTIVEVDSVLINNIVATQNNTLAGHNFIFTKTAPL